MTNGTHRNGTNQRSPARRRPDWATGNWTFYGTACRHG